MNDVKDLCDRILDQPGPPLRDSGQVLEIARRSARDRARLTAAAGSLACLAVAAFALTVTLPGAPSDAPLAGPVTAGPATPAASASVPPTPARAAAHAHGARIAQVLAGAAPAGFTARPDGDTSTWTLATDTTAATPRYVSQTRVLVSDTVGEGTLAAVFVADGGTAPTGDPCATAVTARLNVYRDTPSGTEAGPGDSCSAVSVSGVAVRVDADPAAVTATRFLATGYLMVSWSAAAPDGGTSTAAPGRPWTARDSAGRWPLASSPFTASTLAALAADPRLLP